MSERLRKDNDSLQRDNHRLRLKVDQLKRILLEFDHERLHDISADDV